MNRTDGDSDNYGQRTSNNHNSRHTKRTSPIHGPKRNGNRRNRWTHRIPIQKRANNKQCLKTHIPFFFLFNKTL